MATPLEYSGPVPLPRYGRAMVRLGSVHLAIDAFQAVYIDDVVSADPKWGVRAFPMRRPDTRGAIRRQDRLDTLLERGDTLLAGVIRSVMSMRQGFVTVAVAGPAKQGHYRHSVSEVLDA